jgi:anion-transporting  ArsA/GET3 family ATPase
MNRAFTHIGEHRLLLCMGPGGVGKTTTASALGLRAALEGGAVDVLTIDPAPRLLDALHVDPAISEPQQVALDTLEVGDAGFMRALKLDPKDTFDAVVRRYAPTRAVAKAILDNRLYRNLSDALAGVGDYMAMEKLLELYDNPATDLIVLDTPPAREALDFLGAPERLLDLLNSRATTLLGGGLRLSDLAARAVLSAFDRVTGLHLLSDVHSFVRSFEGMYQGFAERAERARSILAGPECMVVVITTAEELRVEETGAFIRSLDRAGIAIDALIVNRVAPPMPSQAGLAKVKPLALQRKLRRNWRDFAALKEREAGALRMLGGMLPDGGTILAAPDLGREPRTLADLAEIAGTIALADLHRRHKPADAH